MIRSLIEGVKIARATRQSSDRLVKLAQLALHHPELVNHQQIKSLAASVLSQAKPEKMRDEGDVL